mmetsp:Transcript_6430/g.11764  ORF Transcript_6430/g.11764 Transcript_6430/m.11764 type:complete len:123 (-) Transcript_6430:49-417(-)
MGAQLCGGPPRTTHDAASLKEMKAQGTTTKEWSVVLQKRPGASLGMDVDLFEGNLLIIYLVCAEGLAADWNKANPEKAIQKGDRVVEVNQKRGDAWQMAHACIDDEVLNMVVQRTANSSLRL